MLARIAIAVVITIALIAIVEEVGAQPAPPPPCHTIFLPDGRMLICCTTGGITSCF